MFVNRVRLFGIKGFDFSIPSNDEKIPEAASRKLLLLGSNGSGKTTILKTITTLWQYFGRWLDLGDSMPFSLQANRFPGFSVENGNSKKGRCVAIELINFPFCGERLWIGIADESEWKQLKAQNPSAEFAGAILKKGSLPSAQIEHPSKNWQDLRRRSMVGSELLPNLVYIPADNRTLIHTRKTNQSALLNLTHMNWCAIFKPSRSLDDLLLTIKALRPEQFEKTLQLVNLALIHSQKKISGFNQSGRLQVSGTNEFGEPFSHPVEELSSGERQMLLLTAYAAVLLRPGGILLIDEPDLHIGQPMITQLLQTIDFIVQERHGQLIVASHSELVRDYFSRSDEQINLSPWSEVGVGV